MAIFAISTHLFRRFYSCSSRKLVISNLTNSSYSLKRIDSRFDSKQWRYFFFKKEKWITIFFERPDGTCFKRKGKTGITLLDLLREDPDISGYGVCGGEKECTTCHVIFTEEDFSTISKYNSQNEKELDVLADIERYFESSYADYKTDFSRLGCCVKLIPEMDGMKIKLPKTKAITPY